MFCPKISFRAVMWKQLIIFFKALPFTGRFSHQQQNISLHFVFTTYMPAAKLKCNHKLPSQSSVSSLNLNPSIQAQV